MEIHILPLKDHDSQVRIEAEESGTIIGSAYASIIDNSLLLDSISVPFSQRRSGVGSALLHSIITWGKERGATHIRGEFLPEPGTDPNVVQRFYQKHGITLDSNNVLSGNI